MRGDITLVLTHRFDPTADYVVHELNRRAAPVFRCDPGEFPNRLTLTASLATDDTDTGWAGLLRLPERTVSLQDVGCVYYRRPTRFDLPAGMSEQVRRWSTIEARMGFGGVLSAMPRWLNHPVDIGRAEYKPVQLAFAQACGLDVPATLVTNDPAEAVRFLNEIGPAVYKPFHPTGITERAVHRTIYTTPVSAGDIDETVRLTAHLFQARIEKQYDVRLTVVDDVFFAARIESREGPALNDWRTAYDTLAYRPLTEVPTRIRTAVQTLMNRLRLRFGALDFVVAPDGRWWFLEINPNGQWAWIEDATGLPISSAIADALTREVS
ncbi:MAG TPA: ATP-grasp ribosomal peptide maturase [Natronosporangium sp.]